jgi:hypothetical protein
MNDRTLEEFHLPLPDFQMINQLVVNENGDGETTRVEKRLMGETMVAQLNTGQRTVFDQVMAPINQPTNLTLPRQFYLDGPGGSGKKFMYNTFGIVLGGQGKTVIMVASTGIAATLLLHGATYHSTFKIYPPITDTTTSKIEENSYIEKLIRDASLIICEEATMMTRYALKVLDKILRKIMKNNLPYGNKVVVLGGDFRPTWSQATRQNILSATILWRQSITSETWYVLTHCFVALTNILSIFWLLYCLLFD